MKGLGKLKNKYAPILVFILCCFIGSILMIPKTVKVQLGYGVWDKDEKALGIYLLDENLEKYASSGYNHFANGTAVTILPERSLDDFSYIQVKFRDREAGEQIPISTMNLALDNFVFYSGDVFDSQGIVTHDIAVDKERRAYTVIGEDPFLIMGNPKELLEASKGSILFRYFLYWVIAGAVFVFLYLICYEDLRKSLSGFVRFVQKEWRQGIFLGICVIFGILAGLLLRAGNIRFFHFRELQNCEILVWTTLLGILFWLLHRRIESLPYALFATALLAVVLLFAVKGTAAFLTADEQGSLREHAKLAKDGLRHWLYYELRTSYMLTGAFFQIFPYEWWEERFGLEYQQIGKLFHEAVGILLIYKTVDLMQVYLQKNLKKADKWKIAFNYVSMFSLVLLLPAVTIGLKNYNYDTLSMAFGVLGIAYAWRAFHDKNLMHGFKAVIFCYLGLLEKIVISPVLLLACVLFCSAPLLGEDKERKRLPERKDLKKSFLCAFSIAPILWILGLVNQWLVLGVLKKGLTPIQGFADLTGMTVGKILILNTIARRANSPYMRWLLLWAILGICVFAGAVIVRQLCYIMHTSQGKTIFRYSRTGVSILLLLFLGLGIVFSFRGALYREEWIPYLQYALKSYFLALPTVIVVLSLLFGIFHNRFYGHLSILWGMILMSWGGVLATLYNIRWNPTWYRYINIFHYMYVLLLLLAVLPVLYELLAGQYALLGAGGMIVLLHVWELSGSMPAFSYFLPCWYGLTALGEEEAFYHCYWGENHAVLGQRIVDYCNANGMAGEPIQIYYGYYRGVWITKPDYVTDVTETDREWDMHRRDCSMTDHDFYAIDTQAVERDDMALKGWPENAEPIYVERYRGYVLAKIYRGCDLKEYLTEE